MFLGQQAVYMVSTRALFFIPYPIALHVIDDFDSNSRPSPLCEKFCYRSHWIFARVDLEMSYVA